MPKSVKATLRDLVSLKVAFTDRQPRVGPDVREWHIEGL